MPGIYLFEYFCTGENGVEIPAGGREKFLTKNAFTRKEFIKKDLDLEFEVKSVGFRCKKPDVRDKMSKYSIELEL